MLLWFLITAPILVAEVFKSPMVDYRLVAVGALLPLIEVVSGVFLGLHTLVVAVGALALVMVTTSGHRLVRRRLLGVPIGLFCHLVLDGTWTRTKLFWWPAFGLDTHLGWPETGRSLVWGVLLEILAVVFGVWAWRRYGLDQEANRHLLARQGHLARGVLT
jgi:hypothetical protein